MSRWIFSFIFFPLVTHAHSPDLSKVREHAPGAAQVVWVQSTTAPTSIAQLWAYVNGKWAQVGPEFAVVVGRNGTIPAAGKFEGDGKTPQGLFSMTKVFGRGPRSSLKIPYTMIQANDKWIDDPQHPDYNRWIRGDTSATSYEILQRTDSQYDLFAVINYNTENTVPGKGSAIFMHIWAAPTKGTAGCIAMAPEQIGLVMDWLDLKMKPQMLIGGLEK